MSGSGKSDISITITLADNAHAKVNGIYALNEQQQCSIQTRQYHHGIDSSSSLIINGSASDQSVLTYNGIIAVEKSASRTSASQENKTILFGSAARAVSVPSLEVQTNDVQCAHGSAIGMLNVEHLRYAQSRGMDIEQAQRLLLTSFFAQALGSNATVFDSESIIKRLVTKALGVMV
jgi:Fe-S cluster assembly protein SufD